MDELCAVTEGFSYSDIEYAIKDAALLCLTEGQEVLTMELVLEKFRQIVPISKNNPEMLEKIRKWGEERAVAASDRKERA